MHVPSFYKAKALYQKIADSTQELGFKKFLLKHATKVSLFIQQPPSRIPLYIKRQLRISTMDKNDKPRRRLLCTREEINFVKAHTQVTCYCDKICGRFFGTHAIKKNSISPSEDLLTKKPKPLQRA